jgi:hypothetical protein
MSTGPRTLESAAIVVLITALIYAAGWSYAYHWYDRFDLGLIGLGIPSEYHFMYGFWVAQSFWWVVLLLATLLTAALLFWDRAGCVLVSIVPIWVPLTFVMSYLLGAVAAAGDYRDHKDSGFQRYPWVRVWTEPHTGVEKLNVVRQDLAEGKYRLLLQTDQTLYLIKPKSGGEMPTLQVPKGQIRALRRIPTNPGSR